MAKSIGILLVDDHALLRETLGARIECEPDMHVAGDAADAEEALKVATRTDPEVLLMDIDMPGRDSFEVAREICRSREGVALVFLSAFHNDRYIDAALSAGALSYVTKDEPPDTLVDVIRKAAAGVGYFSPKVRERLVVSEKDTVRLSGGGASTRASLLTQRELEVLRYIANGLSKKQIAEAMHRSYSTVDKHTENLMNKLDIHDRVELARFAIREGIAES